MKTIKRGLASLALVLVGGAANAQMMLGKDVYAEVGLLDTRVERSTSTAKPLLGRVIVGQDLSKNLSVEGLAGFNLRKDAGVSATTYGVFLKPRMTVIPDVDVFARVGVAQTEEKVTGGSATSSTKVAYGVGIQTMLNKAIYTQIDFMQYGKDDQGHKINGFAFSAGYRF
jgi:hypothetical protein